MSSEGAPRAKEMGLVTADIDGKITG
jgi:hypothetical protein